MKFQNKLTGELVFFSPIMINSNLVSAQNRKRLYWSNLNITQPKNKEILLNDILEIQHHTHYNKAPVILASHRPYLDDVLLSPIETERLQNIPDDYTSGIDPNHRYYVLGNSFTVDVISHILKNIYNKKMKIMYYGIILFIIISFSGLIIAVNTIPKQYVSQYMNVRR